MTRAFTTIARRAIMHGQAVAGSADMFSEDTWSLTTGFIILIGVCFGIILIFG